MRSPRHSLVFLALLALLGFTDPAISSAQNASATNPLVLACAAPWGADDSCGGCSGLTWQVPLGSLNVKATPTTGVTDFWTKLSALPATANVAITTTSTIKAGATASCSQVTGTATAASLLGATPAPTVSLAANPTSVTVGSATTLTWSSANATSCTASGGWSGSEPTSGSTVTGNLTANTTFTLTCSGVSGSSSQSVTVTVTGQSTCPTPTPPVVSPPAGTGQLYFYWTVPTVDTSGNALTDITGYLVSWGAASKNYTASVMVTNGVNLNIANLPKGTPVYIAVQAMSKSEGLSAVTNEVVGTP